MPMFPPRIKRRRIGYGRRNSLVPYQRRSVVGRALRAIGAPPMMHTFARPCQKITLADDGTNFKINNVLIGGSASGNTLGMATNGITSYGSLFNTVSIGLSQLFQLSYVNRLADLAGLYDNYRIKMVKVRIDLSMSSAPGVSGSGATVMNAYGMPMLHYAIDTDDNTAPTTTDQVLEYTKSRSLRLGDGPTWINFVPRATSVVAASSAPGGLPTATLGAQLPANTWLDVQTAASVPHYGIKMTLENLPTGFVASTGGQPQYPWVIEFTPIYILEMKNVH